MQSQSAESYLAINPPDKHAPSESLDGDGRLADPLESSVDAQHSVLLLQGDSSSRPPQVLRKSAKHGEKVRNKTKTPHIVVTKVLNLMVRKTFCPKVAWRETIPAVRRRKEKLIACLR